MQFRGVVEETGNAAIAWENPGDASGEPA